MDGKNSLSKRSVGSIAMAALLLMGVIAVLPLTNSASAQTGTTITTSADANGARFFGPAILEVLVNVSSHASDTGQGSLPVTINAFGASQTYQIQETGTTSGLFLIYIKVDPDTAQANEPLVPVTPFSNVNTRLYIAPGTIAGYPGSGTVGTNGVITSPGSPTSSNNSVKAELAASASNIVEGGSVQISANGVTKTITWDDSTAALTLDRTAYGPGATIIPQLKDQDSNLDPTRAETITETTTAGDELATGTDAPANVATVWTETGPNTGTFEVTSSTLTVSGLSAGVDTLARSMSGNDFKAFNQSAALGTITPAVSAAGYNIATTVQGTATASYTVQNVRGQFGTLAAPSYSSELSLRVDDLDRNTNSRSQQLYTGPLLVTVSNQASGLGSTSNPLKYNLKEQNLNSNIFVPNYSGDYIQLVPGQPANITPADQTSGILRVQPGNTVTVSYNDTSFNSGAGAIQSTVTFEITNTAPTLTVDKTTASPGAVLNYNMTDPDLNDDSGVIESYTVTFTGNTNFSSNTNPKVVSSFGGQLFDARIRVSGATQTLTTPFSMTFIETGPNTGVFRAQLNLLTFDNAVGGTFAFTDGDTIQLTIKDVMDQSLSVFPEVSQTTTIGLGKPTVTIDRSTYGVPRNSGLAATTDSGLSVTPAFANLGPQVMAVTIIDPSANTNAQIQETLISSGTNISTNANGILTLNATGTSNNKLRISLLNSASAAFSGAGSITVSKAFRETGFDTGVFTGEIQVNFAPNDTPAQWIGSKAKFEYAGQNNSFGDSDDADTVSVGFTARNAVLQTDTTVIASGKSITITVRDDDANRDSAVAEQVSVGLRWTDTTGATVNQSTTLDETGVNTGIFSKKLDIGTSVVGGVTLNVQADTDFRIRYYDLTPSLPGASSWPAASSSQTQIDLTLRTTAATGGLVLSPTQVGPATQIKVTVTDTDLNTNPSTKQTVTGRVTAVSDRGAASRADVNVDETGPNTGVFEGKVRLNAAQAAGAANSPSNDVTINALPGDIVSIRYEDERGVNGQRTTISKTVQVVSVDPKMNFSKATYSVGESIELTLTDLDANRDPDTADILTLRATSNTDAVGLTNVQAIETGPATGVFKATIQTSQTFSTGALQVNNGDNVTVEYTDQFPANFRARFDAAGTLAAAEQKFRVNTVVGQGATPTSTTATAPALLNLDGSSVTEVTTGQQVVVGTTVRNNDAQARPITVLIEVRDSDGITVLMSFQRATVAANGTIDVGTSWLPETPGQYQTRTFVVTSLDNPQALSGVVTSNVTVS